MKHMLYISLIFLTLGTFASCTNDVSMGEKESETKKTQTPLPGDVDGDGVLDEDDNCPTLANADQADEDGDGLGDVCEGLAETCESNFCQDHGFLSGYHCDGSASVRCGLDEVTSGCLAQLGKSDCSHGCQTEGAQEGFCAAAPEFSGAPKITGVDGDTSHGSTLSIEGEELGTHTLDVEWTGDWIEDQAEGTRPNTKPGWTYTYRLDGIRDHVSRSRSWSGDQSIDISIDQTIEPYSDASTLTYLREPFESIYVSFWTYVQPLAHNPANPKNKTGNKYLYITCDTCGGTPPLGVPNNSVMNVMNYSQSTDQQVTFHFENNTWNECVKDAFNASFEDAFGIDDFPLSSSLYWRKMINGGGNDHDDSPLYGPTVGAWSRVEWWAYRGDPDTPDGELMWAITRPGEGKSIGHHTGGVVLQTDRTDCRNSPDPWQRFVFFNFYDYPANGGALEKLDSYIDDVYLQFGTKAHVELGDQPNYRECTLLEIQPPNSWGDTSVEIDVNHGGSFQAGQTAFVFITREDGTVSGGYPIILE